MPAALGLSRGHLSGHDREQLRREAILLALEDHRDQGYLNTLRLAERIGWDNDGMPSPNGQGYGRIAVIGLLYKLYLAGKVEPAHQPNRRGHWGGWRISDEESARRSGEDAERTSRLPNRCTSPAPCSAGRSRWRSTRCLRRKA